MSRIPTAPIAASSLIAGYAVAAYGGSRILATLVLTVAGLWCVRIWVRNRGRQVAVKLSATVLAALVVSHPLGLVIGAWPSVLATSALLAVAVSIYADAPRRRSSITR
jgi:hypothetical protein